MGTAEASTNGRKPRSTELSPDGHKVTQGLQCIAQPTYRRSTLPSPASNRSTITSRRITSLPNPGPYISNAGTVSAPAGRRDRERPASGAKGSKMGQMKLTRAAVNLLPGRPGPGVQSGGNASHIRKWLQHLPGTFYMRADERTSSLPLSPSQPHPHLSRPLPQSQAPRAPWVPRAPSGPSSRRPRV